MKCSLKVSEAGEKLPEITDQILTFVKMNVWRTFKEKFLFCGKRKRNCGRHIRIVFILKFIYQPIVEREII